MNSKAPGKSAAMDISRGGALYAHGDILIGENNRFIGNTAAGSGGAVFAQNNIAKAITYENGERTSKLTTEVLDIMVGNGSSLLRQHGRGQRRSHRLRADNPACNAGGRQCGRPL